MEFIKKKKIKTLNLVPKPKFRSGSIHLARRNQEQWEHDMERIDAWVFNSHLERLNEDMDRIENAHKRKVKKINFQFKLIMGGIILGFLLQIAAAILKIYGK